MAHRLDPLLQPASIAFVGATPNAARIGGMPLDHLRHFAYAGAVYPINPKHESIFGWPCYPDLESLPQIPDLLVLAIAAPEVVPMLRRAHERGIRAAIVYAAGFAEAGESGAQVQTDLEAFIEQTDMVIAGPNCMGFANLNSHAYTAFAQVFRNVPDQSEPGRVSLVTQSGNVCAAVFALVRELGVPVSHFINTGNEAALEFSEYLEFLAQDAQTDCILGYVEQLRDGRRFIDAAVSCAQAGKPLVLYKAGETEKGSEAVRSHTSALAGNLALYKAAFEQLNIIPGNDFAQMADLAMLSGYRDRSAGLRVAIVTVSGALGAILADKFIAAGLEVPTFSDELQAQLRAGIPDYGMVSNPVDCTGNVVNDTSFVTSIATSLAQSPDVDVVVFYAMSGLLDRMAEPLIEVCKAHQKLFVAIDTGAAKSRSLLAANGIPVFTDIGRAMRALAPFCQWHHRRPQIARWAQLRSAPAERATAETLASVRLNEFETKQALARYGVPTLTEVVAKTVDEAAAAAVRSGFPVALKILSADIAHKTEVDGVRLHLKDEAMVRAAFDEIMASAARAAPLAKLDGVLVAPMVSGVAELIAGVTTDPVFGQALTVGLGGVLTELYGDVCHRLLPVDDSLAGDMLRQLKAYPLLDGYRGRATADEQAAKAAIAGLARAAQALSGQVAELEINPLLVLPQGQGAVALDALILPGDGAQ